MNIPVKSIYFKWKKGHYFFKDFVYASRTSCFETNFAMLQVSKAEYIEARRTSFSR